MHKVLSSYARVHYIKVRISEQRTKKKKCFFLFFGSFEREYLFIKHGKAASAASRFVKKIPNPSGSGVAYFRATAPSLANTPKMSIFRKRLLFNDLTTTQPLLPPTKWQLELQFAAYWWAICGILVGNMRHIGSQFAAYYMLRDHLRPRYRTSLTTSGTISDVANAYSACCPRSKTGKKLNLFLSR